MPWRTLAEETARWLANARQRRVSRLRLSGGEPTLGKAHLLGVLERVDGHGYSFILETNVLPIGQDPVAPALARYRHLHVRVSLRAGSAAGFQARTDAFYQATLCWSLWSTGR